MRAELLAATIKYVSTQIPYYIGLNYESCLNQLADFPIINKEVVRERWQDFLCPAIGSSEFNLLTTGSTTGKPLVLITTPRETTRIKEVVGGIKPLKTLELESGNHGVALSTSNRNHIKLPAKFDGHDELILETITTGLEIPQETFRPLRLIGGTNSIKRLTRLYSSKYEDRSNSLKEVVVYSSMLSNYWRERVSSALNVKVIELFGLSEFNRGTAARCQYCDCFHFPITVQPEFLAFEDSILQKQPRVRRLLLSHIYPFNESQMFIRYDTEDAILLSAEKCPELGEFGFVWLGRVNDILSLSDEKSLVLPAFIEEAMDEVLKDHAKMTIKKIEENGILIEIENRFLSKGEKVDFLNKLRSIYESIQTNTVFPEVEFAE